MRARVTGWDGAAQPAAAGDSLPRSWGPKLRLRDRIPQRWDRAACPEVGAVRDSGGRSGECDRGLAGARSWGRDGRSMWGKPRPCSWCWWPCDPSSVLAAAFKALFCPVSVPS